MKIVCLAAMLVTLATQALAHSGGLNKQGCIYKIIYINLFFHYFSYNSK